MAIPIINDWQKYFSNPHEGLGSSYERVILNGMLFHFAKTYNVKSIIETPSFGFTGISGINLMGLAKAGFEVSIEDHDAARLTKVKQLWQGLGIPLSIKFNNGYSVLDYPTNSFDMGYNFSAMWFVRDIERFIGELTRIVSKLIIICVPNRNGIGYKMQIKDYNPKAYPDLLPENINAEAIVQLMSRHGWQMIKKSYIDCPPWPDIGMNKELFIKRLLHMKARDTKEILTPINPISILPYYKGIDSSFETRMMRYSFIEAIAPVIFKKYWAHHQYLAFIPKEM